MQHNSIAPFPLCYYNSTLVFIYDVRKDEQLTVNRLYETNGVIVGFD